MKENPHERAICDAVMNFHENRTSGPIKIHSRPEEEDRCAPSVEYLYSSPSGLIAVEHTRIESFSGQIQDDIRFMDLLAPLEQDLKDQLPKPGKYKLYVDINEADRARGDFDTIRKSIASWVRKKAPSLEFGTLKTAPHHMVREQPSGVPFVCTLYRFPGRDHFFVGRHAPEDIEQLRRKRIATALYKKLPKLSDAKNQVGTNAYSILILESNDIALANSSDIGDAFQYAIETYESIAPDRVYLIETEIKPWCLTVLKDEATIFPNCRNMDPTQLP